MGDAWTEFLAQRGRTPAFPGRLGVSGGVTPHFVRVGGGLRLAVGRAFPVLPDFATVMTILLVAMFAVGVALLLQSANMLALYRSKVPRDQQGGAGAKSALLIVVGVLLAGTALTWFIVRSVSST